MYLTDIREFKKSASIDPDDTSEDAVINYCIEWASNWIEEYLNRKLSLKQRTEYYDGTGTQTLQLRARPVYSVPEISVRVDEAGFYGSTSGAFASDTALTYGGDFCLKIDQDDGIRSRCGLLIRMKSYWPRPSVRQRGLLAAFIGNDHGSIKITYTAGYTVDELPAQLRMACNILVNKLRYILPIGMELGSESYEERHISIIARQKNYFMSLIAPMLFTFRNWKF